MGWFDKRSWQLRGKIKDLQSDLLKAEEEGKFIIEQGLFFAELEDMGEVTMMVFGATNELNSGETEVIRNFFERNGFLVETVKLDRASTGLSECEIIPPEEFTRHIGKALKADGWRLVDDSEVEHAANLQERIYPLSALIRSIAILFSEQVRSVAARSKIKHNKEGNRLLHWMPKIVETISKKCPPEIVEVVRPYFDGAYQVFFGNVVSSREKSSIQPAGDKARIGSVQFESKSSGFSSATQPQPAAGSGASPQPILPPPPAPTAVPQLGSPTFRPNLPPRPDPPAASLQANAPTPGPLPKAPPIPPATTSEAELILQHQLRTARALAALYKSLIGANPSRCVRNAETLLATIHKLLDASAVCVLKKVPGTNNLSIHAQAGQKLVWGEGSEGGFPISSSTVSECLRTSKVISKEQTDASGDANSSMVMNSIISSAAAPIICESEILGVLYVDRRGGMKPYTELEKQSLKWAAQVFEEFPEPTLGISS